MIVLLLLLLISSIILAAVLLSTLANASSRTTIGELTSSALPSAVLSLSPPLNVIPLSPTKVLNLWDLVNLVYFYIFQILYLLF